mgnify:FL=1
MNDCPRLGRLIGGCKFEARYDKSEPKINGNFTYHGMQGSARLEQLRQLTYVRDVCIRCGRTVNRTDGTQ